MRDKEQLKLDLVIDKKDEKEKRGDGKERK
jgi:hypothetical protein